jgi:hypothetical protein
MEEDDDDDGDDGDGDEEEEDDIPWDELARDDEGSSSQSSMSAQVPPALRPPRRSRVDACMEATDADRDTLLGAAVQVGVPNSNVPKRWSWGEGGRPRSAHAWWRLGESRISFVLSCLANCTPTVLGPLL